MDRLMTLLALPPLSLRTNTGDEFANKSVIVIVIVIVMVSTRTKLAVGTLIEAKIGIVAEIGIGVESTGSTSIRASIHTGGRVQGTGARMVITADTGTAAALGIAIESTDMGIEIVRAEIGTATETMIVTVAETMTGNVASVRGKKETN
jgi:hypothetical protein